MSQKFKTIYFQDHPAEKASSKNIKLAFGPKDEYLYDFISPLSSEEIRGLLGHSSYGALREDSAHYELPLNSYCLKLLKDKLKKVDGKKNRSFYFDPIQTTFKGGETEPLQNWYPFLEGYSPKFVESVLKTFVSDAKIIFDPFSGTGTTPLTVSKLGIPAYYCEINPFLQFLIDAKIKSLTLENKNKRQLLHSLEDVKRNLNKEIENNIPDSMLDENYRFVFGDSIFFNPANYDLVLRLRALIEHICCYDPLAAEYLTIATLSCLIPASLLTRAGDLRFKTKNEIERCGEINLIELLTKTLQRIIDDIDALERIKVPPKLVCEDAKKIEQLPPLGIEGVITSPPYLNGTNYFRNTKIELWFLKCLSRESDLTSFRKKAITAGINDVHFSSELDDTHPQISELVKKLSEAAYDARIPRMVAAYFSDMKKVFDGLKKHLVNDSTIAIDIGDSVYGGVHVQTDNLLVEILKSLDYSFVNKVLLRKRLSRDRTSLHQVLLVFKYKSANGNYRRKQFSDLGWMKSWNDFKINLPHRVFPFSKRNWGHPLHSLCSYQGKMKPALAHFLVKTFLSSNSTILDPFSGVGTIPFEACLEGHNAYCFEISPAARIISEAKIHKANVGECEKILASLNTYLDSNTPQKYDVESAARIKFNGSLIDYFHEKTFSEILVARKYFRNNPPSTPSESLVFASLLHILHGNRPYALSRRSHPITPFAPTGKSEYRSLINKLKEKVARSLEISYPESFKEGKVFHQDATGHWPQEIHDLDAVITSPPFFDSTRFHLGNWMRLWFCGWEREDFQSKPLNFVDEKQKINLNIYESIFRQSRERLKKGGVVVMHLGKSKKCNMGESLSEIARKWFKTVDLFSETVTNCESHGIRDKGTVTAHQYLLLQ